MSKKKKAKAALRLLPPPPPAKRQNWAHKRTATAFDAAVGKRIRQARELRKLKLDDVAALVEVSRQMMSEYELGQTRLPFERVVMIAVKLDVSMEQLAGLKPLPVELTPLSAEERIAAFKKLMEARGFNAHSLARAAGLNQPGPLYSFLTGKQRSFGRDNAAKLARVLGVPINGLYGD